MENNGHDVGLLRATDVSFAGYFYIIHQCIRCIQPLKAKVHGTPWTNFKNKKAIVVRAAADVDSDLYWRQSYVVFCTVFPEILALRLDDSNNATMEKI